MKKAQAAIYDGILLLLLTALASTIIFVYVGGTYGQSEDKALRAVYELNYLQSVMKAMYYVDAGTLQNVGKLDDPDVYQEHVVDGVTWIALNDVNAGCPVLKNYRGSISVTDLLKRDLGEGKDTPALVELDDKYGSAAVPGKTAMRCAMKELMKPFAYAGYRYYVEARDPKGGNLQGSDTSPLCGPGDQSLTSGSSECNIPVEGAQITNSRNSDVLLGGCETAAKQSTQLLSMSSPFRVLKTGLAVGGTTFESKIVDYKIRICVWPAANETS